jgi:hypothetical protein
LIGELAETSKNPKVIMLNKEILNIKEASQIIGVQPHVLRYWEVEFLQLKAEKDEQGQRVYAKRDIDILLRIRELLYVGKHTIISARKELSKEFG